MIKYICPNCKRTTEREKKKVLVVCGCGYEMVLIKCFTPKGSLKTELKRGFKKWNI